jgi:uncharacterized Ntn-hydrolase superfamily protein
VTFSLVARCARTGQLGVASATSDLAVGARVAHARAGTGAVLTQHRTDPRLGPRGLGLLGSGCDAAAAVRALVASTADHGWRQLAVVDAAGGVGAFSGERVEEPFAELRGDGYVVLGNMLAGPEVGTAMARAADDAEPDLGERLVRSLEAGAAAGGEGRPLRSSALLVVDREPFPLVDLRVDLDERPVERLRALWDAYRPRIAEFVLRALEPDAVDGVRS